jgi:hypothetical protein
MRYALALALALAATPATAMQHFHCGKVDNVVSWRRGYTDADNKRILRQRDFRYDGKSDTLYYKGKACTPWTYEDYKKAYPES